MSQVEQRAHDLGLRVSVFPTDQERLYNIARIISGTRATLRWKHEGPLLVADLKAGKHRWRLGGKAPATATATAEIMVATMIVSLTHEYAGCACSAGTAPCPAALAYGRALSRRAAA